MQMFAVLTVTLLPLRSHTLPSLPRRPTRFEQSRTDRRHQVMRLPIRPTLNHLYHHQPHSRSWLTQLRIEENWKHRSRVSVSFLLMKPHPLVHTEVVEATLMWIWIITITDMNLSKTCLLMNTLTSTKKCEEFNMLRQSEMLPVVVHPLSLWSELLYVKSVWTRWRYPLMRIEGTPMGYTHAISARRRWTAATRDGFVVIALLIIASIACAWLK